MLESAIALAARSVSQGDYPAQSAFFYDNKKKRLGISFLCEVFFFHDIPSSSERTQINPFGLFSFYSQSQSSSKPFSLLLSTLNCHLWLRYPRRSGLVFPGGTLPSQQIESVSLSKTKWKVKKELTHDFFAFFCEYSSRHTSACLCFKLTRSSTCGFQRS